MTQYAGAAVHGGSGFVCLSGPDRHLREGMLYGALSGLFAPQTVEERRET